MAPDTLVAVAYRLYDAEGARVDEVTADDPLRYVHGCAQIIPGLERGLDGAAVGERRRLVLEPELAFGHRDEAATLEIDPEDFPDASRAAVGDEIVAEAPDGVEVAYRIVEIDEDAIVVDGNHPLAGQTVVFDAEVVAIRPATDAELDAAQRDVDERIVYDSAIVYGSDAAGDGSDGAGLIQLRTAPAGDEDEP